MSEGRSIGFGAIASVALAAALFLVDRTGDTVVNEIEKVVMPCQHSGVWDPSTESCRCVGPFSGKYCGECTCQNGGVCDTNSVQVATPGTLWGCRCRDRYLGAECEQCNAELTDDGRCVGDCVDGFTGPDCDVLCAAKPTFEEVILDASGEYEKEFQLLSYGGTLNVCSGHGACDPFTSECRCDPFFFASEDGRSSCLRTCLSTNGVLCAGHGVCAERSNVVSCTCRVGYHLTPGCSLACPGMEIDWLRESCAGHGACRLDGPDRAVCDCGKLFRGEACQYRCPSGALIKSSEACSGHGVCAVDDSAGFPSAVCTCETPYVGPGCGCTSSITCSGHGACRDSDGGCDCDPLWRGARCDKCVPGHFGSDCKLQCSAFAPIGFDAGDFVEGENIHCHGRGTCAVINFALADEAVVCGSCVGEFAPESHCEECRDSFFPKMSAVLAIVADERTAESRACTTFANAGTCNYAGAPRPTFGMPGTTDTPCACDAAHADETSFCTECEEGYYPANLRDDPAGACSRRCVDDKNEVVFDPADFGDGLLTLRCANGGVCAEDGLRCECVDGYSGVDCGIACGDSSDGPQCNGHGRCVTNIVQGLLEFEINERQFNASRCECDPGSDIGEDERLRVFRGLETASGENTLAAERDWYGETCGFACLSAPWRDGTECNNQRCKKTAIRDDAGTPILTCSQDAECGAYKDGILTFDDRYLFDDGAGNLGLSTSQSKLVGAVSASRRWSAQTGPFCSVPNTPPEVWRPSMACRQRVNKDGRSDDTEASCESYASRADCLRYGEGVCEYVDVCLEALDDFDVWSYCYELLRTEEPPLLRSKACAGSCAFGALHDVDWGARCAHYVDRIPDGFAECTSNLDALCDAEDATLAVSGCANALPPESASISLDAVDSSAFCWETSGATGAMSYPFDFSPLLDTARARHLQAQFQETFLSVGERDAALKSVIVDVSAGCSLLPSVDDVQPRVLYACSDSPLPRTADETAFGVSCEAKTTLRELNPFELRCLDATRGLVDVDVLEAVDASFKAECALHAKSDVYASAIGVNDAEAMRICRAALDAEDPTHCAEVCGDDVCSDLGAARDGKRVFECERKDASFVPVDDQGVCGECDVGACSITGRKGGSQYRCVVPSAEELRQRRVPASFLPCRDTLLLHADKIAPGDASAGGVAGYHAVDAGAVVLPESSRASLPARVEFDVKMSSSARGRVSVDGTNGSIASLMLHYYGDDGFDLNAPLREKSSCPAGDDACRRVVAPRQFYRVVAQFDWEAGTTTLVFDGENAVVRNITLEAGAFVGVSVSGSARVKDLWIFSATSPNHERTCANLHRKLGRSVTFRESLKPATAAPATSMAFCAGAEAAFSLEASTFSAGRDALFSVPWKALCEYDDYLSSLSDSRRCLGGGADRDKTVSCAPILSRFTTQECAKSATFYDWQGEYCAPLRNDTVPEDLAKAGCSETCLAEVAETDMAAFCADRDLYWSENAPLPSFLPDDCEDNGMWSKVDWATFCTEKAENTAQGYCSAATCDCRGASGGWNSGDACELECPMGADFSPCAEDSFGGRCAYKKELDAKADAFYEDSTNLIYNHPTMEILGRCMCSHSEALAEEGCRVRCSVDGELEGLPACNDRVYDHNGLEWQISSCDSGGSGVCHCMPPMTRKELRNVSNWRGKTASVLVVEFGDPSENKFRVYAQQGAKQLMVKYFGALESAWETTKLLFESKPHQFLCGDDRDRPCNFHDVVIAQGLYASSSFYGSTCSRRCPGADTGEDMVYFAAGCDANASTIVGDDQLSQEGCQTECLDDFRCNYAQWDAATSVCLHFLDCVGAGAEHSWTRRELVRPPRLDACTNRGRCGITGQCACDAAMLLSLTDPITGQKSIIQSNRRDSFASPRPISTLDITPYRGDACEITCPGYDETRKSMGDVCSGRGTCTRAGKCQCDVNYVGVNCELRCPVKDLTVEDDQTVCSGHGTCSEARIFAGSDASKEDSKRYYMVTEAYRQWHNECLDNTPIDYFILPFENFPGSVASSNIKGGVDCESVPQEDDDPTKPFIERPKINLKGLSDYALLDDEKALDDEITAGKIAQVDGVSAFDRKGMFRRRFWYENEQLKQQTLFVEDFAIVESLGNGTTTTYAKFYGYACPDTLSNNVFSVETAADCAEICESVSDCTCFHFREHYHRKFVGQCVLGGDGPLRSYAAAKVSYIHTTDGLLQRLMPDSEFYETGVVVPFDEFDSNYVALHLDENNPSSCRAPTLILGSNVQSVTACAELCAGSTLGIGCVYFSFESTSRRCLQVRTTSAECVEGMVPNPAGFYAISLNNTGAIAPTAYTRSGTARIFPRSVPERGRLTGTYVGRARPGFETAIASCDCLSNAAWGYWDGHRCQTCQKFYGSKTCSRRCPGVTAAEQPCFGFGKCLWGSKDGEGEEFFQSRCLCGDPPAPYVDDLASVGVWDVQEFDLHVEATFNGLPPSEAYEDPRNYNFASSSCSGCREGFGGLNCASTCSYCMFGGSCSFTPSTVSVSVPCNCIGGDYDPYNSCCPMGFLMVEALVHNDVGILTTSLRRKRLMQVAGTVTTQPFYDTAVFPGLSSSPNPSRRWCAPAPGVTEKGSWMKNALDATSNACSDKGVARDRGIRKLRIGAAPSKYFPQTCSELGSYDDGTNYWESFEKTLWYTYPNRVFLAFENDEASSAYAGIGDLSAPLSDDYTQFVAECRALCVARQLCTGVVVRTRADGYACFVAFHDYVGKPRSSAFGNYELEQTVVAYRQQTHPQFCKHVNDPQKICVLGSVVYGELPLCANMNIGALDISMTDLGHRCEVYDDASQSWNVGTQDACEGSGNARIDEHTNVLASRVPKASALLFGAYGNAETVASAGSVLPNIGVMRPENPCATLAGDYFWNKDNRSQCISASTRQTCGVREWRHCTNFDANLDHTNQYLIHALGTHPHNIAVLGMDLHTQLDGPLKAVFHTVASCTVSSQCDICQGTCTSNDQCLGDLVCNSDKDFEYIETHCKGEKKLGVSYCLPKKEIPSGVWRNDENVKLYVATAITAENTASSWLLEMKETSAEQKLIIGAHARVDRAAPPVYENACGPFYGKCGASKPWCDKTTYTCVGPRPIAPDSENWLKAWVPPDSGNSGHVQKQWKLYNGVIRERNADGSGTPRDVAVQGGHLVKCLFKLIPNGDYERFAVILKAVSAYSNTAGWKVNIIKERAATGPVVVDASVATINQAKGYGLNKNTFFLDNDIIKVTGVYKGVEDIYTDSPSGCPGALAEEPIYTDDALYNYYLTAPNNQCGYNHYVNYINNNIYGTENNFYGNCIDERFPYCFTTNQFSKTANSACKDCSGCSSGFPIVLNYVSGEFDNVNGWYRQSSMWQIDAGIYWRTTSSAGGQINYYSKPGYDPGADFDTSLGTKGIPKTEGQSGVFVNLALRCIFFDSSQGVFMGLGTDNKAYSGSNSAINTIDNEWFPYDDEQTYTFDTCYKFKTGWYHKHGQPIHNPDNAQFDPNNPEDYPRSTNIKVNLAIPSMPIALMLRSDNTLPADYVTQKIEVTGTAFTTGVSGAISLGNAPWMQEHQTRSLRRESAEACVRVCDDTYGCTAAHWSNKNCFLFSFDPSLACTPFADAQDTLSSATGTHSDSAKNIPECEKDCDTGTNQCADGLKCFETDSGERVPGCKGSYGSSDVCYDPAKIKIGFVRYADACHLCKSRGLRSYVDAAFTDSKFSGKSPLFCSQANFYSTNPEPCAIVPNEKTLAWDEADSTIPWRQPRCPPTRAGIESSMHTYTTIVGETYHAKPLLTLHSDTGMIMYSQCETACAENPLCRAWRFQTHSEGNVCFKQRYTFRGIGRCKNSHDWSGTATGWDIDTSSSLYSPDTAEECMLRCLDKDASVKAFATHKTRDECYCATDECSEKAPIRSSVEYSRYLISAESETCEAHVCDLFDTMPARVPTSSDDADVFLGDVRIGTVERDFSPKIAFFDDGQHAACDCFDDGVVSYDCGCSGASLIPFGGEITNEVYGCAGHGRCSSLEYKCICDDGYGWLWAAADGSVGEGYTCRECPYGTFKDSSVSTCTQCPTGKYQDEEGQSECKRPRDVCNFGQFVLDEVHCDNCPAGFFSNTTDAAKCSECPLGYSSYAIASECKACPEGYFQADAEIGTCKACLPGRYSDEGVGQSTEDACKACPAGTFSDDGEAQISSNVCKACPAGRFSTSAAQISNATCVPCNPGYYQQLEGQSAGCKACPAGYYESESGQAKCSPCTTAFYQPQSGKNACISCGKGKYGIDPFYSDAPRTTETLCQDCKVGQFNKYTGQSTCEDCPKGYYQNQEGKMECKSCSAGYYQNRKYQTSCKLCPSGYFQENTNGEACEACPHGWDTTAESRTACVNVTGAESTENEASS